MVDFFEIPEDEVLDTIDIATSDDNADWIKYANPAATDADRGASMILNSGKPCGDSFIEEGDTCHVGGTDSPEFKAWFGNSKVVDKDGKPMVVYKAMYPYDPEDDTKLLREIDRKEKFPSFLRDDPGVKIAGFFGDKKTANTFGSIASVNFAIYPVYLSFQKPFVIEAKGRKAGIVQFEKTGQEFRDAIRSGKYDSVIIKDTPDEGTVYVALHPNQIKSQFNRGTWSKTDTDLSNSGKPCGDGFIESGDTCHIGESEIPADQIVRSRLDTDFYILTQNAVIHKNWPNATGEYEFINRGGTNFPPGFDAALQKQIDGIGNLSVTPEEKQYLKNTGLFDDEYLDWFAKSKMDPKEIEIHQDGGDLSIWAHGPLDKVMDWEVPLMSTVSELNYKMTGQVPDIGWENKLDAKWNQMSGAGAKVMEFGTRRRFSHDVQDKAIARIKDKPGFIGTSNVELAMKHGVPVKGTYAHASVMAMSALHGPERANDAWNDAWTKHYGGKLNIALPDTFTTDHFLTSFNRDRADKFVGVRQDSGDPHVFADKFIAHWNKLGIDPKTKSVVFSDNLNPDKVVELHKAYRGVTNPTFGIGTNITNDVGVKPLNMVVKLTKADFGNGPIDVVKLSDSPGKHTGRPEAIQRVKQALHIANSSVGRVAMLMNGKACGDGFIEEGETCHVADNQLNPEEQQYAISKLKSLPTETDSDYAKAYNQESVNLAHIGITQSSWNYKKHPGGSKSIERTGRMVNVPTNSIYSTPNQRSVSKAGLAAYIVRQPDPKKDGWPEMIRVGDRYHIVSGHTRIGSAMLGGRKYVRAKVFKYGEDGFPNSKLTNVSSVSRIARIVNAGTSVGARLGWERRPRTESPEFKAWFSGSKVVNLDRTPKVLFHGTTNEFKNFDEDKSHIGIHMTEGHGAANYYGGGEGGRVFPMYASIKKPWLTRDLGKWDAWDVSNELAKQGLTGARREAMDEMAKDPEYDRGSEGHNRAIKRYLERKFGFDGIHYLNRYEVIGDDENSLPASRFGEVWDAKDVDDAEFRKRFPMARDSWIAFHGNQVKSVNNKGTWSDKNDLLNSTAVSEPTANDESDDADGSDVPFSAWAFGDWPERDDETKADGPGVMPVIPDGQKIKNSEGVGHPFHGNQWTEHIQDYLRDSYGLNSSLRFYPDDIGEWNAAKVKSLDAAILASEPISRTFPLYRAVGTDLIKRYKLQPGSVWQDPGYLSTTVSKRGVNNPGYVHPDERLVITIIGSKGVKALDMKAAMQHSPNPKAVALATGEKEYLFARNTKLKIHSIDLDKRVMTAEIMHDDKVANAGKPCGDSFIEAGDTCHVGTNVQTYEGRPVQTHPDSESQKYNYVRAGAPPPPPDLTPARVKWGNQWVVGKSGDGLTYNERMAEKINSPDPKVRKDWQKTNAENEGDEAVYSERTGIAKSLGFKPQGELETDTKFRDRIAKDEANPKSPFSPKNPDQTYTLDYKGRAHTLKESELDAWTLSNNRAHAWNYIAAKEAGADPQKEAEDYFGKVDQEPMWMPTEEYFTKPTKPENESTEYWRDIAAGRQKMWEPLKDRALAIFKRRAEIGDQIYKIDYNDPDYYNKRTAMKNEDFALLNEIKSYARKISGAALTIGAGENAYRGNAVRGILGLRDEAQTSLKKPAPIFRGIPMSTNGIRDIKADLEKNGYVDIPCRRLTSWTTREALAGQFAKYGQGKKGSADAGIVLRTDVTKDNVWMHPDQPNYRAMALDRKRTGSKFHSGGTDQKEVVVENPTGMIRITKENVKFID